MNQQSSVIVKFRAAARGLGKPKVRGRPIGESSGRLVRGSKGSPPYVDNSGINSKCYFPKMISFDRQNEVGVAYRLKPSFTKQAQDEVSVTANYTYTITRSRVIEVMAYP